MKEKIIRLLEEKKLGELREELQRINPADLAILLEDLDEKERPAAAKGTGGGYVFFYGQRYAGGPDQWLYGP